MPEHRAMTGLILPNRRAGVTDCIWWPAPGGRRVHVTTNFLPEEDADEARRTRRVCEIFLRGGSQVGSDRDFLLDDIAVAVSLGLQAGVTVDKYVTAMARSWEPQTPFAPMSMLGAVLDKAREMAR